MNPDTVYPSLFFRQNTHPNHQLVTSTTSLESCIGFLWGWSRFIILKQKKQVGEWGESLPHWLVGDSGTNWIPHLKGVHKSRISSAPDRDDFIDVWNQFGMGCDDTSEKYVKNSTQLISSYLISSHVFYSSSHIN